jgi:hypothetical protein
MGSGGRATEDWRSGARVWSFGEVIYMLFMGLGFNPILGFFWPIKHTTTTT